MIDHWPNWTLIVAANNERVLQDTLLRSPEVDVACQVLIKRGFSSAAFAYNAGLAEATSEIVVLAHQDVYFPRGWKPDLERALRWLAAKDPHWGVLGVFGITGDPDNRPAGYCYSTGLKRVLGAPFEHPIAAQTLDELVLIVRRSSGLRFDERLPGFHLYGTDLCLQTRAAGKNCYILPAFCIHNSNGVKYLPAAYWRCYFFLRRKWRHLLPVTTCCSRISRSLGPVFAQIMSDAMHWLAGGRKVGTRNVDVVRLHRALLIAGKVYASWEDVEEHV